MILDQRRASAALVLLISPWGCEAKSTPHSSAPSPHSSSAPASATPAASTPPALTPPNAPKLLGLTEEDYEEDALLDLTAENLEAELDKLEAEIGE